MHVDVDGPAKHVRVPASHVLPSAADKEELLGLFRNAFINMARPMLAFAEAIPVDLFSMDSDYDNGVAQDQDNQSASQDGEGRGMGDKSRRASRSFSIWDQLQVPSSAQEATIGWLLQFLEDNYGAVCQTMSVGDTLLYADFLPDAENREDSSLADVLRAIAVDDESYAEGDGDERADHGGSGGDRGGGDGHSTETAVVARGFVDVDCLCVSAASGEDITLPPLRVPWVPEKSESSAYDSDPTNGAVAALTSRLKAWWGQAKG
jgi:hypothetical protein